MNLLEMDNSRKKTEELITNIASQPLYHIVKILRYDDPINFKHHISDINNWFYQIQDNLLKYKGKQLKQNHLLNWIFVDQNGNNLLVKLSRFERNGRFEEYSSLPKLESFEQVIIKMNDMYPKIAKDLLNDQFEGISIYLGNDR